MRAIAAFARSITPSYSGRLVQAVFDEMAQVERSNPHLAIVARFDADPHEVVDRGRQHRAAVIVVPVREVGATPHEADPQGCDGVDAGVVGDMGTAPV